jgi:hypothetical protein
MTSTERIERDHSMDRILAFGLAKADSQQIKRDSLIMIGERYWYVVEQNDSQTLYPALNAKLSRPYEILNKYHEKLSTDIEGANGILSAALYPGEQRFTTDFCLKYQLDTTQPALYQQEKNTLEQTDFTPDMVQKDTYRQCHDIEGTFYSSPQNLPEDYRFENSIPAKLAIVEERTSIDKSNVARTALLTPVAIAADVIGSVLFLPLGTIAVIAD